jgi:CBS domain-containing protein/gamma-glutamylcysteine synthetase
MGEHAVEQTDERQLKTFMRALLEDLHALEEMIDAGRIEEGVRRIGAEQEMFLVGRDLRPAPVSMEVLRRANDPRLTTEIARFNLEANLTPLDLGGDCFRRLERELDELVSLARAAAGECGADVLLTGILPTLQKSDLTLANVTPCPRYFELNRAISSLRGGAFNIHIKGLDELMTTHDNVMMESCNTSFQIHLQAGASEFARLYNVAQAVTAPVLAAAVNSPLLLGHRLWQETRLALFQHSVDARTPSQQLRQFPTRVGFGDGWLKESVLEIFREDIARFRVLMTTQCEENSLEVLARGGVPKLSALRLHNGTVWRWNRPCYGISENGRPHLRIENRVLPAGPTIIDEVANAAFYVGLMISASEEYGEIDRVMSFDDAKTNFYAAARHGLRAQMAWVGGKSLSATRLILEQLLPLARAGLAHSSVESGDIDRYLGVIEERVRSGQTGAQWMLSSLSTLAPHGTSDMRQRALTAAMLARQQTNEPVHKWEGFEVKEPDDWSQNYRTVGQFMSTDLFTMRPDDLVDFAASVMDWRHIRHVPVEDEEGHLVGLVSHRDLLRLLARGAHERSESVTVRSIMKTAPVTVSPQTPTLEAVALMRTQKVGCLPVVEDGALVGIVTAQDFLDASAKLFEQHLTSHAEMDSADAEPTRD